MNFYYIFFKKNLGFKIEKFLLNILKWMDNKKSFPPFCARSIDMVGKETPFLIYYAMVS